MNLQKLNEVETYTNLWNKFKGIFHKKENKEEVSDGIQDETSTSEDYSDTTEKASTDYPQEKDKTEKKPRQIDVVQIFRLMSKHKLLYIIILPVVFILSALYIFDEPRTYTSTTTMAPEISDGNSANSGSLSSIAQSFGIDLSNMQSVDAISPLLYPDLMTDNGFVASLFNINLQTTTSDSVITLYNYIAYHQEESWCTQKLNGIQTWIRGKISKKDSKIRKSIPNNENMGFNPYELSEKDEMIAKSIRSDVSIDVDKKTGVISISVVSQDPLASKIITDSVRGRLQDFITKYRTSKAQRDVDYYEGLAKEAKKEYEASRRKYAATADENTDVILESQKSKIEDLENTMQLQYNRYTTLNTQLDAARAKLRQYTPAFTVIQGAAVEMKPTGPKRMIFVLLSVFVAFFLITLYSIRKLIFTE